MFASGPSLLRVRFKQWSVFLACAALILGGCTKEITVAMPNTATRWVVEGTIQDGQPPRILLSRTESYFDPLDLNAVAAMYHHDADLRIVHGVDTITLQRICSNDVPDDELTLLGEQLGIDPDVLRDADICYYTDPTNTLIGQVGHSYTLLIEAEGTTLRSTTHIPRVVQLDSTWFKLSEEHPGDDSLGYVWGRLHDPDTTGNAYRLLTRRINSYSDGGVKDNIFTSAPGSAFNDVFINGLTFDLFTLRGTSPYRDNGDNYGDEGHHFKTGDTVVMKFISMDYTEYDFYQSLENNTNSLGDLFSVPANVESNVDGGLGIWAGWGVALDTVICR